MGTCRRRVRVFLQMAKERNRFGHARSLQASPRQPFLSQPYKNQASKKSYDSVQRSLRNPFVQGKAHHQAQPLKATRKYNIKKPIKEAVRIMKPKQIFISILAVLFVFPLMGTFAQQAANSGSLEVITPFDYPGTGIVTTSPQKINERGDIVGEFIDSN